MLKKIWIYTQKYEFIGVMISFIFNIISWNRKKIKGKNNIVHYERTFLKKTSIIIIGNNNVVSIKKNAVLINTGILIVGNNHKIEIGEQCIIKNSGFCFEDNGCKILIDDKTTAEGIQVAALELDTSIIIGSDCMFSANISIRNSDSHSIIDVVTHERINYAKDIVIGNHVWVAEDVKILKGASIGNNSIIGMGSIVTQKISNNSIAVGTPARVIKGNVDWKRERMYKTNL
ncbi:acyltransferase [Paenibacillus sp. FSL L8-0470]|uniref:acyltransferase n=1 Tax=unclassified Paenibacillus TaxID=185978 RepID=UPI0030FA9576